MEEIVNKVAASGLISLDLADYYPREEEVEVFDIRGFLFMEMILKEKDFRAGMQSLDWDKYRDKNVAITCTADAIIPRWAYMLIASYLQPVARDLAFGDAAFLKKQLMLKRLSQIDLEEFRDQRIVIKGCGDIDIPAEAFVEITRLLRPVVRSILYGEPCSTVPVYKRK